MDFGSPQCSGHLPVSQVQSRVGSIDAKAKRCKLTFLGYICVGLLLKALQGITCGQEQHMISIACMLVYVINLAVNLCTDEPVLCSAPD